MNQIVWTKYFALTIAYILQLNYYWILINNERKFNELKYGLYLWALSTVAWVNDLLQTGQV